VYGSRIADIPVIVRHGRTSIPRSSSSMTVLLGTVALEPNRWGTVDRSGRATIDLAEWLPGIEAAGFDGIELWERHASNDVLGGPVPVTVFNTYVSFDDEDDARRSDVAATVRRAGSAGVKFNVGNDLALVDAYAARIATWLAVLPEDVAALCECHAGISVAEDPAVAAAIFEAAGPPSRVQAIVHTHEDADHVRARFDAYGDRIGHVHVNFLDAAGRSAPRLADVRDRLEAQVSLVRGLGFRGSWTVEFVAGLRSERDRPELLLAQAAEDLVVLRDVLG
jgi:sugar phosphate isomerase/epimerase